MQHKLLASLLASSSLLSFAACGSDGGNTVTPEYDADFSAADEAHRGRAVMAAMGFDAMLAGLTTAGYAEFPDDTESSCPTITKNGDETTVTGGCTMDDGTSVEGRIVFSNVRGAFGGGDYDATKPTSIRFERYAMSSLPGPDEETFYYDGTFVSTPSSASSGTLTIDLTVNLNGLEAHSDLELQCDDGICTAGEGSWVRVPGLGTAGVEGSWSLSAQSPSGNLILDGKQVLEVDFASSTRECLAYSIDGEEQPDYCGEL